MLSAPRAAVSGKSRVLEEPCFLTGPILAGLQRAALLLWGEAIGTPPAHRPTYYTVNSAGPRGRVGLRSGLSFTKSVPGQDPLEVANLVRVLRGSWSRWRS